MATKRGRKPYRDPKTGRFITEARARRLRLIKPKKRKPKRKPKVRPAPKKPPRKPPKKPPKKPPRKPPKKPPRKPPRKVGPGARRLEWGRAFLDEVASRMPDVATRVRVARNPRGGVDGELRIGGPDRDALITLEQAWDDSLPNHPHVRSWWVYGLILFQVIVEEPEPKKWYTSMRGLDGVQLGVMRTTDDAAFVWTTIRQVVDNTIQVGERAPAFVLVRINSDANAPDWVGEKRKKTR